MRRTLLGSCVIVLLSLMNVAVSAAEPAHDAGTAPHANAATATATAHHDRQPALPQSSPLGGSMIILIVGLFLAAAIVGPVVRYHAPEQAPDVSHDEHGHGAHDPHGHDAHGAHGHGH